MLLKDIGEKKLISDYIIPKFFSNCRNAIIGDDCAVCSLNDALHICTSTDRVPHDLIFYKHGLIDEYQLGKYLAILNISDLAACGARPLGLLANIAANKNEKLQNFLSIMDGIKDGCSEYNCDLLGGDISDSEVWNLVGTSIGICEGYLPLRRSGAQPGDIVFCSNFLGLTPSAFANLFFTKKNKIIFTQKELTTLGDVFYFPKAMINLGTRLAKNTIGSTCMDNTDGIAQTLSELAGMSKVAFHVYEDKLPIHPLCHKVADWVGISALDLALQPGGDLQLVGTINPNYWGMIARSVDIHNIGTVESGAGLWLTSTRQESRQYSATGWNYFSP